MLKRHLAIALLPFASTQNVQLPIDTDAKLSIGMNTGYHHSSYNQKNQLEIMPQAFFDNHRWYIEGAEAGFYPYKDNINHVRVGLSYDGRNFDPADAKTEELKQLNERQWSVAAHASYMHITPIGGLKAKVTTDTLGRNHGQTITLSHLSKFNKDKLTVYPEFGVIWQSRRYNQYYYGVLDSESERTNLPTYEARSGTSRFASVTANYKLSNHVHVFANGRLEWLSSTQKNSPLTNGSVDAKSRIGINYQF